jgi:hypothetical protein
MALPFAPDAASLSMNVLFPEAYKASARRTAIDLAGFAIAITTTLVVLALLF